MAILRLSKAREATHLKAEDYKRHVRQYMESLGFAEESNSAREGNLADLIVLPQVSAQDRRPRWVECKATTLGLGDKKFGAEVKKYLAAWLNRRPAARFDFWVFAQKLNSSKQWEQVFGDEVDADALFKWLKGQGASKAVQKTIDAANRTDIISFFVESHVVDADAPDLDRVTQDRLKGEGLIHASRKRAQTELELIEKRRDPLTANSTLMANLVPIVMPKRFSVIYTDFGSLDQIQAGFRDQPRGPNDPPPKRPPWAYLGDGRLLAVHHDHVEQDFRPIAGRLLETFDLDEVEDMYSVELITLMNRVIEKVAFRRGVAHGDYGYYFLAEDEIAKGDSREIAAGGRTLQVATPKFKIEKKTDEDVAIPTFGGLKAERVTTAKKEVAYVYHEGFTARFHRLWDGHYVILGLKRSYTEDGRRRIEGARAAALDETYRDPRFNRADAQSRKLEVMSRYLFGTDYAWTTRPDWAKQVRFGDLVTIPIGWEPKKVDMRVPAYFQDSEGETS